MSLTSLLERINSRRAKSAVFPLVTKGFTQRLETLKREREAGGEIYVNENFLIELNETIAENEEEKQQISIEKTRIHDFLTCLYKSIYGQNYQPNLAIPVLKKNHKQLANDNLINGANRNDEELVEAALKADANIDSKDGNETALLIALRHGYYKMAQKLIKNGADVQPIFSGGLDAVRLMVNAGFKINEDFFIEAILWGNIQIIDFLVQNVKEENAFIKNARDGLNQQDYNDLMFYVAIGNIEEVKRRLASVDSQDIKAKNRALQIAAKLGRTELADLLLQAGAEVDTTANNLGRITSLMLAAEEGHSDMVNLLLYNKANPNKRATLLDAPSTALGMATAGNHANVVDLLLKAPGIVINWKQGLNSQNKQIVELYKAKSTALNLDELKFALENQVTRFKENGKSWFSINNNYKAKLIEDAVSRAEQSGYKPSSIQDYLNFTVIGQASIKDALSYHRIGFFGKPKSQVEIETLVNTLGQ